MTAIRKKFQICKRAVLALIIGAGVLSNSALAQQPSQSFPKELDDYVAASVRDWEIPGVAIAVVKDGKVLVVKGYGVRELGKPETIDENTIFDAASLTKSFTAAAIASLVDEKKMSWDDPVRRYIPTIEFPDPYLTANITMRDLLCHRTGIRATNSAWYFTGLKRSQLLGLIKNMEIATPFRTQWVYSNVGFTVAGEAAARAAGTTWEDLITQRLIVPLGMKRTTVVFTLSPAMGNIASGHALVNGVQRVTPREGIPRETTAPAGAIQSSAADLATWMIFQLGDGTFQGKRILSAEAMNEMHLPQIIIPANQAFRTARQIKYFGGYGLGWQVMDYRGNRMFWHSGTGDGQSAFLELLPDSRLGVLVLINSWKAGGAALNNAIASRIVDYYLGLPTRDYNAEFHESWRRSVQQQIEATQKFEASQLKGTTPTLPLSEYAGVYRDKLGLDVKVWLEGDNLRLQYGGGEAAVLRHWHHDTFWARWQNPLHAEQRSTFVQFTLSPQATVAELQMDLSGDRITAHR
jgi:CubicO group peptidase (beta-lactamase class C family)